MIKKYLSVMLICLLLVTTNFYIVSAQSQADKTASTIVKVKDAVMKRNTGKNKRVQVIMQNDTEFRGYISQAGDESFELTDSKTKQSRSIFYRDVKKVRGTGLSKTVIISLGVVGTVAAIVLYAVLAPICNEGGC